VRYHQVTHPYTATLTIDPVMLHRLRRLVDDDNGEVVVGEVDRSKPDIWHVTLHCASQAVADRMEDGWA
jgi:hypothetical protein